MLAVNLDDLTIGDVEDIEEITGMSVQDINWEKPPMKVLRAMVFVSERKSNPDFTLDDARRVKVSELGQAPNPTVDGAAS
jgi:hypothetical protein